MHDARGAQQRDGGPEQAGAQGQVAHAPEFAAAGERVDRARSFCSDTRSPTSALR